MARIRRVEFEDVEDFTMTAMTHEANEQFYREIASATVKPVLERLRAEVYERFGKRYPWNQIVGLGMQLYSLARNGLDISLQLALELGRKYTGLDRRAIEAIYNVIANVVGAVPRRR